MEVLRGTKISECPRRETATGENLFSAGRLSFCVEHSRGVLGITPTSIWELNSWFFCFKMDTERTNRWHHPS